MIQSEGRTFLIENRCPHMDSPLGNGSVRQDIIRCPKHGIEFNLLTGKGSAPGCLAPLKIFTPAYEGNLIGIVL
nr:Rieske (2Fe-2S) protein [Aestuariicella hydrocarbonica]